MIIQENLGNGLVRTYSNLGFKIHGGYPEGDYDYSYDPAEANRVFTETDIPVESTYVPEGPKQYSKVKILLAAQDAGFVENLISFIESNKRIQYIWNASNVIEDNELLSEYISVISDALGKTESEIRSFLDENCIVD